MGDRSARGSVSFNPSIKITWQSESSSPVAEMPLLRESIERTEIDSWLHARLQGARNQRKIVRHLVALMQIQWFHLALESHNHADGARIEEDPCLRLGWERHRGLGPVAAGVGCLALKPTLARSLKILSEEPNLGVLRKAVGELARQQILQENQGRPLKHMVMDVGNAPVRVAGQEPTGNPDTFSPDRMHHGILALRADGGDLLGAAVRAATAGAGGLIREIVRQQRGRSCKSVLVRMGAPLPCGGLLDELEEDGIEYLARIDHDSALEKAAGPLVYPSSYLSPSGDGARLHEVHHQAGDWTRKRRVVLVVTKKPGELFHDYFGLVTNLPEATRKSSSLLELWHLRGNAEEIFGKLVNFLAPAPLYSPRPKRYHPDNPAGYPPHGAHGKPGNGADGVEHGNEALFLLNALTYKLIR